MSVEKELIKTAILGTAKYSPNTMGSILSNEIESIKKGQSDNEDAFLKSSFLVLNYFEAAVQLAKNTGPAKEAPPEVKTYAPLRFQNTFERVINKGNARLIAFAQRQLLQKNMIVSPRLVPALLNLALKHKELANQAFLDCLGLRAAWLAQFNKNWQTLFGAKTKALDWELMDFNSRLLYVADLRKHHPQEVIALLKQTLPQENANNRLAFIEVLEQNSGKYDEEFLMELLQDRSTKVQNKAAALLQELPGSVVNKAFAEHFFNAIHIKEERRLLMGKKRLLEVKETRPADVLFSFGLEQISSQKGFSDHLFWMAQCLTVVPPDAIAHKYILPKDEIFKLFVNHNDYDLLKPFLVQWAINFKDTQLAGLLIEKSGMADNRLLDVLPEAKQNEILTQNLQKEPQGTNMGPPAQALLYIINRNKPIDYDLTVFVIRTLKRAPYLITAAQYTELAYLLPLSHKNNLQELAHRIGDGHFELRFLKNQLNEMLYILEEMERLTIN
ncbi:hypothetical protein GC194_04610 [bacterium]|nr:hypothetical protein [bacterium]